MAVYNGMFPASPIVSTATRTAYNNNDNNDSTTAATSTVRQYY